MTISGLSISVAIYWIASTLPSISASWIDVFIYVVLSLIILSLFLVPGFMGLLTPFVEKIVVTEDGLEYHTLAFILWSDWEKFVYVSEVVQGRTGKADVLFPFCPVFILRGWAKRVPWDLMGEAIWRGIPISWFGGFRQKKFFEAIKMYAPYLEYWES